MKYILDANVFIHAARFYYAFDFGSKFWDFLVEKAEEGILFSIDKVYDEINGGKDKLKDWANESFKRYFLSTERDEILVSYAEIVQWASNQRNTYKQSVIDEFLEEENADAWIIAFAKTYNFTVVTDEKYNPKTRKKILIPVVCLYYKIPYLDTFTMLKKLNFKL